MHKDMALSKASLCVKGIKTHQPKYRLCHCLRERCRTFDTHNMVVSAASSRIFDQPCGLAGGTSCELILSKLAPDPRLRSRCKMGGHLSALTTNTV